jgi:hypothetical protein
MTRFTQQGFARYRLSHSTAAYRSAASTTGAKLPPDAFVLLPGLLKMVFVLWSKLRDVQVLNGIVPFSLSVWME